jgi:hypothetical protein
LPIEARGNLHLLRSQFGNGLTIARWLGQCLLVLFLVAPLV